MPLLHPLGVYSRGFVLVWIVNLVASYGQFDLIVIIVV